MNLDITEDERELLVYGLTALAKRRTDALQCVQYTLHKNQAVTELSFGDVGLGEISNLARKLGGSVQGPV
jgi:hypothetical protein